jgi:uroporphyrinogen decarboxylase
MRQAGRYLPEYREIRAKHDVVEICENPELCAKVSTLPVEILGVDAAIMFADIMLPLEGMGVRYQIKEGIGPIVENPIRDLRGAESLGELQAKSDVAYVLEAIRLTKKRLDGRVPLIGFCGAPFTLASYVIEGRPTRDFVNTKALMYRDMHAWAILMGKLTDAMIDYLNAQVGAGVDAVQLFDSWVGCLSPRDYRQYAFPFSKRILDELKSAGVPSIHFGTGTSSLLPEMKEAGGNVIGIDWRIPIDEAWQRVGHDVSMQGNLDPASLLANIDLVKTHAAEVLDRVSGRPGHIFNLGHGVLPDTPVENLTELVKFVHGFRRGAWTRTDN